MASRSRVVVMAKAPVPGYAKTRLVPALGDEGAARLAGRLLERTMAQARLAACGELVLACAPDTTHAAFIAQRQQGGVALAAQGDGDLGARMQRQFVQAFADGARRVLLIGTDAPGLDAVVLRKADAALAHLAGLDAVFVPALDGGYALIGLRCAAPSRLFDAMPWSTAQVMAATRERLAAVGLRHVELDAVRDIDGPDDLQHLPAGWL